MSLNTLYPFSFSYTDPLPNRQGRSKKKLKPLVEYVGGIFVAHYEGRPSRFFGASAAEAEHNLQAGGQ
jgi:hypothetical protein